MPVSHTSRSSTCLARFGVFGVGVDGAVSAASFRFRRLGVLGTGRVVVAVLVVVVVAAVLDGAAGLERLCGPPGFVGLESLVIGERLGASLESGLCCFILGTIKD